MVELCRRLESDPTLSEITHVIVDEVHERSEESDFLLMILRDTLPKVNNKLLSLLNMKITFSSKFKKKLLFLIQLSFPPYND